MNSMCSVRECLELEEGFGTKWTECILRGVGESHREVKEESRKIDRACVKSRCEGKAPLIARFAGERGWARLWDDCLELGNRYVGGMRNLSRILAHHGRGVYPCPCCDSSVLEGSLLCHMLGVHGRELGIEGGCLVDDLMGRHGSADVAWVQRFSWCMTTTDENTVFELCVEFYGSFLVQISFHFFNYG